VVNPFSEKMESLVYAEQTGVISAELIEQSGKIVIRKNFPVNAGVNQIVIGNTDNIPAGLYFLRLISAGKAIEIKVLKSK
jgi:hypothetical protein